MRTASYISLFVVQIFFSKVCLSQREEIDRLTKSLPHLRDSAMVDCLNDLSGIYLASIPPKKPVTNPGIVDTAGVYANLAYEKAMKINYLHGLAEALSYKAEIEDFSDKFRLAEKLSREAIALYRNTPNKKRLAETYRVLGSALFAQSFFSEAIKTLDTAYEWYSKEGKISGKYWAFTTGVYIESGNYEKAFEFSRKGLDRAIQNNEVFFQGIHLLHLGIVYRNIENYTTALEHFRQAFANLTPEAMINSFGAVQFLYFIELFTLQQQYDSARYYYSFVDTSNHRALRFYLTSMGEYHLLQRQYDTALPMFARALEYHRQLNDRSLVIITLIDLAKTYLELGKNDSAFKYANEGLSIAKETGARKMIKDACQILSSIYDHRHLPDSAYFFHKLYITMKDSIQNDVIKGKLAAYTFGQKIELLNKEKQIQKMQLQKQSFIKNILFGCIAILLLLAAFIVRNIALKRKNERHHRELAENELHIQRLETQKKLAELEMQALRAQMNPHFIFNSLNSINMFILENNKLDASDYLSKFSKLVRMILQHSQEAFIPLDREIEALRLYLELESLRFGQRFEYKILVNEVDSTMVKVPPLIIQPYAENAIWHGLMQKNEKGHLEIELYSTDEILFCRITDDGIGRKKAGELRSKSSLTNKSMGMRITADRLAILQQEQNENFISVKDLVYPDGSAAGTEVRIKVPVRHD